MLKVIYTKYCMTLNGNPLLEGHWEHVICVLVSPCKSAEFVRLIMFTICIGNVYHMH